MSLPPSMETNSRSHWETVYEKADVERLGWHEPDPARSIEMIERCGILPGDLVLDVGSGASTLISALLSRGCLNVAAVDISASALHEAQGRLPSDEAQRVEWIVDDILSPKGLDAFEARVKVWHDRALLHFLIHDEERGRYRDTLRRLVAGDGYVIIAAFSLQGVDRCSGLPVRRYNAAAISDFLGPEFELRHAFECLYLTPAGDPRPYVYTLSRRVSGGTAGPSAPGSGDPTLPLD